jgi:DNA-binding transcriptional ArsR family regulator
VGSWQIGIDTLARSRFVISPLAETSASLVALESGAAAHPGEHQWLAGHRRAYLRYADDHPAIPALMRAATRHWWMPSLVFRVPDFEGEPSIDRELEQVAAMAPGKVAADLAEIGLQPDSDTAGLPGTAALLLEWVWVNTVLPYWAVRRRIIEADIAARTSKLGRGGWTEVLDDMRPGMRWLGDGRLQINAFDRPPREISGNAQLMFIPVTLSTGGWADWDEPDRYALTYQCSGTLASHGRPAAPQTLAALLGRARAVILTLLATPKTTTQLVMLTGQRLGSVARHLKILHEAGLLERHRVGRFVLYSRSPAGDSLVRIQNESAEQGVDRLTPNTCS